MDFTNAQTHAPNPWIRRIGRNTSLVSPITFHGLGVLGAMNPARANVFPDYDNGYYDEETEEYIIPDMEGYTVCLTEVVPWPFSEDDAGVEFDQDNLRGVRTRVWRIPIADGGGDKEWWTAVPKELPEGYTAVGRCALMEPTTLIQDFLGDDPMVGFSWNHRTPTGLLLDTSTEEGGARSLWTPMNLNQQVTEFDTGSVGGGSWSYLPYPPFAAFDYWAVALIASDHIGFRGGSILISNYNAGTVLGTLEVVALRSDQVWDPGVLDPEVLETHSVSITGVGTQTVTLGELYPSTPGVVHNFWIRYDAGGGGFPGPSPIPTPITNTNHHVSLSPRTDVPLPYFASQRNRVAPGGVVLP